MAQKKVILAGGYVRDILFADEACLQRHLESLQLRAIQYKILDRTDRDDGQVIVRIVQQYNNSPLIQLYED